MIKIKNLLLSALLLCVAFGAIVLVKKIIDTTHTTSANKKILILTSFGGGGNLAASTALESYLKNDYDVQSCYVFKELLSSIDPLSYITGQKHTGEELYNWFMPGKFFRVLGWIYYFGVWYFQLQKKTIHGILHDYFIKTKPDLIISVIPIINNIVLDVAQELNIPFLLMPTDLDVKPYIVNVKKPTYKKFYVGIPFDDEEIKVPLNNADIPENQIILVGSPLRTNFFTQKNKSQLKRELTIDEGKPVIMLLMGAQGSDEIKHYVKELLKVSNPINIIACIGKNEKSKEDLAKLSIPPHICLSVIGFTDRIADYMAISDLFISKSGTLSVSEALYMNLPLLLDATSTLLPWEEFNHQFIKKHGFGDSIQKYKHIAPLITTITGNSNQLEIYKDSIQNLQKENCSLEAVKLIEKMLGN